METTKDANDADIITSVIRKAITLRGILIGSVSQ